MPWNNNPPVVHFRLIKKKRETKDKKTCKARRHSVFLTTTSTLYSTNYFFNLYCLSRVSDRLFFKFLLNSLWLLQLRWPFPLCGCDSPVFIFQRPRPAQILRTSIKKNSIDPIVVVSTLFNVSPNPCHHNYLGNIHSLSLSPVFMSFFD